jgi:hypothetical protein
MPNLTVRNIPESDYTELQRDAKHKRRNINAEILKLLADKAEMNHCRRHAAKVMKRIDKIREEIARRYPNQPDSVDLIREDRDTR